MSGRQSSYQQIDRWRSSAIFRERCSVRHANSGFADSRGSNGRPDGVVETAWLPFRDYQAVAVVTSRCERQHTNPARECLSVGRE